MKKVWVLILSLAVVFVVVFGWIFFGKGPKTHATLLAPEFALRDSSGNLRRLNETRGKITLVHFWATWCPPCVEELPQIAEFVSRVESRDVWMVVISLDESWDKASKLLEKTKFSRNVISLLDPEQVSSEAYGSYQFPETYLLDREHQIRAKWIGPQNWNDPYFLQAIETLEK